MKINIECIRDILFTVEEETAYNKNFWYQDANQDSKKWDDFSRLKAYSYDEVCYHLNQCNENGYFVSHRQRTKPLTFWLKGGFMVQDLSPKGHEFISNIREDTNWKKTKEKAKTMGSFALSSLEKIASNIIVAQINNLINGR